MSRSQIRNSAATFGHPARRVRSARPVGEFGWPLGHFVALRKSWRCVERVVDPSPHLPAVLRTENGRQGALEPEFMTGGVPPPAQRRQARNGGSTGNPNYLLRRRSFVTGRAMLRYALAQWAKNECITTPLPTKSTAHLCRQTPPYERNPKNCKRYRR